MYVCTTCDLRLTDIPDDAVQLTPEYRRVSTYRFADGTIHNIRKVKSVESIHKQWHKKFPRPDCIYCNPPPEPEPPVEQVELLQEVVQVLDELPESQPEITESQEEPDEVEEPTTSMAAAFHRLFKP